MADEHPTTVTCPNCGDVTQQEFLLPQFTCGACDRSFAWPVRRMKPTAFLRFVEMGPQVRVLEQGFVPADGYGGMVEWREVPTVSRKDAGYG